MNYDFSLISNAIFFFIGAYPLFCGVMWTVLALIYWYRRELNNPTNGELFLPPVSIILSARNEEKYIRPALDSILSLNYPTYEILVVDDASTDSTPIILEEYANKKKIRFIKKSMNEGKTEAINDAMMCSNYDFVLIVDADVILSKNSVINMVQHFKRARVGIVAGNPRVRNKINFLTRLQAIEYCSIITMVRRSQRIWGRQMAVSGATFMYRKATFFDVGGFTPASATEDMDFAWKVQMNFWDIVFEENAVAWTLVPTTYLSLYKQRLRWSMGLMQVLHRYRYVLKTWKLRRLWPVFIENIVSTLWCTLTIVLFAIWIFSHLLGQTCTFCLPLVPTLWGMMIATVSMLSITTALFLDTHYDKNLYKLFFYSVYFPIYYWIFLAYINVITTPYFFFSGEHTFPLDS